MSKNKIELVFDKVFWGLLMLTPLLLLLFYTIRTGSTYTLIDIFNNFGFGLDMNNPIFIAFKSIFGSGSSYISIFTNDGLIMYITYIVIVELIHLLVDCLLFIPRVAQKFLDKETR